MAADIYIFGSSTHIDIILKHGIQELNVNIEEDDEAIKCSNILSTMREEY